MHRHDRIPSVLDEHNIPVGQRHLIEMKLFTVASAAHYADVSQPESLFVQAASSVADQKIVEITNSGVLNASDIVATLLTDPKRR